MNLEPPSSFELRISGLGIKHHNHLATAILKNTDTSILTAKTNFKHCVKIMRGSLQNLVGRLESIHGGKMGSFQERGKNLVSICTPAFRLKKCCCFFFCKVREPLSAKIKVNYKLSRYFPNFLYK